MGSVIDIACLGLVPYQEAWRLQREYHARCRVTGENILLLTEHEPIVTLGYRRPREQLLAVSALAQKGIAIVEVERGGGATYHGPGQLVAYPVFSSLFRSCGVRNFVARLEAVMCQVSSQCNVLAARRPGFPGVWVEDRKLGAVGIAVQSGVSLHGFALNVNVDLQPFSYIVPCGIREGGVTSLKQEGGRRIEMRAVLAQTCRAFSEVFAVPVQEKTHEWSGVERTSRQRAMDYH
jgi:lipoyl(octanoyl) transferase